MAMKVESNSTRAINEFDFEVEAELHRARMKRGDCQARRNDFVLRGLRSWAGKEARMVWHEAKRQMEEERRMKQVTRE